MQGVKRHASPARPATYRKWFHLESLPIGNRELHKWAEGNATVCADPVYLDGALIGGTLIQAIDRRADSYEARWLRQSGAAKLVVGLRT